jgi:hypothetical protein
MGEALAAVDWLKVLGGFLSVLATVALILLRRWLKSYDALHPEIQKLWLAMGERVRREQHDVANAEMVAQMDRLRIEAQAREGRILDAIGGAGNAHRGDLKDLRGELANVNARIDRLRDAPDRSRRA